jgi:hypothetical protein
VPLTMVVSVLLIARVLFPVEDHSRCNYRCAAAIVPGIGAAKLQLRSRVSAS